MKVAAAILAAGRGTRFGGDKTGVVLRGRPVWSWSVGAFQRHPEVDHVFLVVAPERLDDYPHIEVVAGGETRQQSSLAAVEAAYDADILLIHDAARPFVSQEVISRVVEGIRIHGAAAAAVPVTDTIKRLRDGQVTDVPRHELFAMQTPQGARTELLRRAHREAPADCTDDLALLEAIGVNPQLVAGDPQNFKITTPDDLLRASAVLGTGETRTGLGYDIHPFSEDPSRPLWLGGVFFPDHVGLHGHSDADVLLHAATDALLGAAALGDIGQHFPNTDERWRGAPSLTFLRHACELLNAEGWQVVHLDMSCIAETPKIMKRADEIRSVIAEALNVSVDRVSIKATTNERLGSIGRGEGIAAFATATIRSR